MIWRPKVGQRVRLQYRRSMRAVCPHGKCGVVEIVANGPGPINAQVLLDDGRRVVVPRGNLGKCEEGERMAQLFAEANEETVRAGLEHMRQAFEEFVNSYPGKVGYVDGFMIAHNLHVLVILDMEAKMQAPPAEQLMIRKMAVDTLQESLERRP